MATGLGTWRLWTWMRTVSMMWWIVEQVEWVHQGEQGGDNSFDKFCCGVGRERWGDRVKTPYHGYLL